MNLFVFSFQTHRFVVFPRNPLFSVSYFITYTVKKYLANFTYQLRMVRRLLPSSITEKLLIQRSSKITQPTGTEIASLEVNLLLMIVIFSRDFVENFAI